MKLKILIPVLASAAISVWPQAQGALTLSQVHQNLDQTFPVILLSMREIRKAGDHLLQLINDVLDLAKIESGKMTVSLEPVLVSRIINEAFTLVQPQADARSIHLYSTTNDLENHYVIADNVRYKQALINLLSNAIKYNNMGGEVEVKLQNCDDTTLRLIVRDNGKGIPASRLTAAQKALLLDLASQWIRIGPEPQATARLAEVSRNLDETYFVWSGPTTPGSAAYFRIQGPTLVIEYAPQNLGGSATNHIHTIYRDPTNEYGKRFGTP